MRQPYLVGDTNVIETGQFTKTVAATGTPEKLWNGVAQVFTVQCVADSAGSLAGRYFDCSDSSGTVRFYFTVAGVGTPPPAPNAGHSVAVNVLANDTATAVATALELKTEAEVDFTSTSSTDTVTVTNVAKGERGAPIAQTSGFTVGVSTAGVSTRKLVSSFSLTGKKARGTDNTGNVWHGSTSANDSQLKLLVPGETQAIYAPDGGSIDLGTIYLDVATNADGVVCAYPAVETPGEVVVTTSGGLTDTQLRASAVPVSDAGPSWTSASGIAGARFTSADQHSAVASVTSAPTSGQKLVITDIIVSVDTAMRVDFNVESSGTVVESIYMAANSTVNLITRSKRKLATADKKLQVQTSVSGNISVNAFYYSEA